MLINMNGMERYGCHLIVRRDHVSDVSDHESLSWLEIQDMGGAHTGIRTSKHHKLHITETIIS